MRLHLSKTFSIFIFPFSILLFSCSPHIRISRLAKKTILREPATNNAFIGISIYDPETNSYLYNHNGDKYFTPASNTKLFSLYAGMKYLGDSLPGLRYTIQNDTLYALPTGDPSFINPEFSYQPAIELLKNKKLPAIFSNENWRDERFGYGWAWDDYNDDYMAERNALPIFANLFEISFRRLPAERASIHPGTIGRLEFHQDKKYSAISVKRKPDENLFDVYIDNFSHYLSVQIPMVTNGISTSLNYLNADHPWISKKDSVFHFPIEIFQLIRSIPSDSLFRPMMHRSDNFFAEQTLLMASNEKLGYMKDADIIDTLLNVDLKDIPQRPKWVDGSGLSRYNLFTPQSFIYILNKLSNEFGRERLFNILPTGGQGTLSSYYLKDRNAIYAKTGTLSNNCALSGFVRVNSGKWLIFSILANHYQSGATPIRKASEQFLEELRKIF